MQVPQNQDQQSPGSQSQPVGGLKHLRTLAGDIAELVRQNKISSRDLAKLDPKIAAAIKHGEVAREFVVRSAPLSNTVAAPDPLTKELNRQGNATAFDEKTFDLNKAEKQFAAAKIPTAEVKKTPPPPPPPPQKKPEPPPPPVEIKKPEPPKELSPAEKLAQEKQKLQTELETMKAQEKSLQEKEINLKQAKAQANTEIQPLRTKEQGIEQAETELWQQVEMQNPTERQAIEKKRWNLEDQRQQIENERWTMDQKILDLEKQLSALMAEETSTHAKTVGLEERIEKIHKQEIALQAVADKVVLLKKFDEIKANRTKLESDWKDLMAKKRQAEQVEAELAKQQQVLEAEIRATEAKEHRASSAVDMHEFETKRWKEEKDLRSIEENVWKSEIDIQSIQGLVEDIQKKSQEVLLLEKTTKDKIAELDNLIRAAGGESPSV